MMVMILQEGSRAVGMTVAEFADMTALELLASGPIALNAATYVGYIKAGFWGSLVATAGICLPPFVVATLLYYLLTHFQNNRYVTAFLDAVKAACGGLLLSAAATLSQSILLRGWALPQIQADPLGAVSWGGALIFGACLLAGLRFKANPILLVLAGAAAGLVLRIN